MSPSSVPSPVVFMTVEGIIQYTNQQVTMLFGWSEDEMKKKNIKMLMGEPFASNHDLFLRKCVVCCAVWAFVGVG